MTSRRQENGEGGSGGGQESGRGIEEKVQGGAVDVIQGMGLSKGKQMEETRTANHYSVARGKSHGGTMLDASMGMIGGDDGDGVGAQRAGRELRK